MYGIFTYIWLIFMVNVGKYIIHGSYGNYLHPSILLSSTISLLEFFFEGWSDNKEARPSVHWATIPLSLSLMYVWYTHLVLIIMMITRTRMLYTWYKSISTYIYIYTHWCEYIHLYLSPPLSHLTPSQAGIPLTPEAMLKQLLSPTKTNKVAWLMSIGNPPVK